MDRLQYEQNTGWRNVFSAIPSTRSMAHKVIMPFGFFYSPFITKVQSYDIAPPHCQKCKAIISHICQRNRQNQYWICNFCLTSNRYTLEIGTKAVQQFKYGKVSENGLFFIIDLCLPKIELQSIKQTLIETIKQLPSNIFIGLISFNRNIFLQDLSHNNKTIKMVCLNGQIDYSIDKYSKLKEILGLTNTTDPRNSNQIITTKYYRPIQSCLNKLISAIQEIQADSYYVPRDIRQKRATGSALQVAINLVHQTGIMTRFIHILSGPCTIGPGKIVDLPLKQTIRSLIDINQGNNNAKYVQSSTNFYQNLSKILVKSQHTMDIWAFGLDQFGLLEMKSMANQTGGLLVMHQAFNHFIFQQSFKKFYQTNQKGMLNFPIAAKLEIKVSKEFKINGIIGTCKSLQQNLTKTASDMQIGQAGTNTWYLGGTNFNSSLCLILSLSEFATDQNKQRSTTIQAITTYILSDNYIRTRVSTINIPIFKINQFQELIKNFDSQAACVMLARIATKKAEIEDHMEVKKWLDRLLLKFTVKFAQYHRMDRNSFKLPTPMRLFPQFIYHLRRSRFINPFGAPPDQSLYNKSCLWRQSLANCIVMIQPILLKYTTQDTDPSPVSLDLAELKEDVVLLLDTYFNVLVWFGEHVQSWKNEGLDKNPDYQYLHDLFKIPVKDAGQIMYERILVSNFYETFKNDGNQRYLKSRVNPSQSNNSSIDGNFVSDDAPVKIFMDYLIRSVVTYNE